MKKMVLKDVASYGPRRMRLTSILDAQDCLEIVSNNETEPNQIVVVNDANNALVNQPAFDSTQVEFKDF